MAGARGKPRPPRLKYKITLQNILRFVQAIQEKVNGGNAAASKDPGPNDPNKVEGQKNRKLYECLLLGHWNFDHLLPHP